VQIAARLMNFLGLHVATGLKATFALVLAPWLGSWCRGEFSWQPGRLFNPLQPGLAPQVLVGADQFVTDEQLPTFTQDMRDREAWLEMVIYPGVAHSFTNPAA